MIAGERALYHKPSLAGDLSSVIPICRAPAIAGASFMRQFHTDLSGRAGACAHILHGGRM